MKNWFTRFFLSKDAISVAKDVVTPMPSLSNEWHDSFVVDAPITEPTLDRFKRWSFAQRVAQTMASRSDPSSIVIGIYGAWGEGKTTVLKFIEKELKESSHVISIWFNPWRFGDESHLLRSFFQTLADALGKSISSQKEKIGEWLRNYATILVPLSFTIGDIVQLSPGESAKKIGKILSSVELEELKKRIEKLLDDEGKRVVVLMDDIDRLDKAEIQTIFKLVKLSAYFKYTAYVLAFDNEMVAEAVGERYGSGNKEAGRSFIEKIVQVPLHLPKADILSLRKFCFDGIGKVLDGAKIQLTEEQTQAFVRHFVDGLEIRLQTPRMANRYINTLLFSLPILKGEVNPIDLMLVEGIRVFYPKLYDVVRGNPDVFLCSKLDTHSNSDQVKKRSLEIINKGLEELTIEESDAAKDLLRVLFPRLGGVFEKINYGREWEDIWAEEQRIASKQYFDRFFSYAVPEGDVSDQELESFLGQIEIESIENIASEIQRLAINRSADRFISKLRRKVKKLSPEISSKLAIAIAKVGNSFPNPETMFTIITAFSQAGMLVVNLIENIPRGRKRIDVAKIIVQEVEPISFVLECFSWMRTGGTKEEQDRIFSIEEEDELGKIIADRTKRLSQDQLPIYIRFPKDAKRLLYAWSHWGNREEVNKYLTKTMNEDPRNALELLKCHLSTEWSMESGLSHKADFAREQYNSIAEIVDTDLVYNALYKIYGSALDSPKYHSNSDQFLDERVTHQFAHIYHQVKTEEQSRKEKPEISKIEDKSGE